MKKAVIYIHGRGGSADGAAHYVPLFPDCEVLGFDYKAQTPWEARDEFTRYFDSVSNEYDGIIIAAESIGAYFAMNARINGRIEKAFLISPVADMEKLILGMMSAAGVTEDELRARRDIGELSWEYLCYVREHPLFWEVPTGILYGENDELSELSAISAFAESIGAALTVMPEGEHRFHTPEQMAFLDRWIRSERPVMLSSRLILRPWEEADAESLFEYARDERVGPIAGWPPHLSVDHSREIIRGVLSAEETYAVCLREDNIAIGSIGLMIGKNSSFGLPENEGEIGYWIGVPFWGRGLIPEAVRELTRRAFCELGMERLWCGWFDGNEKSRRAQVKCGFEYRHTNRDVYWALTDDIRTEHVSCLEKQYARPLLSDELDDAIELMWEVFLRFEAPVYSDEGIRAFRASLDDPVRNASMRWYGAFDCGKLVGVLCVRSPQHIADFFVKEEFQGMGHGRRLFERMKADHPVGGFTVNSSPYAVPIYEKLGFHATDTEQTVDGLIFTPMSRGSDEDLKKHG